MSKRDPMVEHPGQLILMELRKLCGTQHDAAALLGVSDSYLSDILGTRRPLSVRLALELERVGAGSAESWLLKQIQHEIWKERRGRSLESATRKKPK